MAEPRPSATDRLLGLYLALTAVALLFPHRPDGWPVLLVLHLALAGLLLTGVVARARSAAGSRGVAALVVAWYPLLLMPFLYWELPHLIGSVWDERFFDGSVMAWEERVFGHQPSATLAARWDSLLLSETLHLAYLSYYPIIYFFPAALYLRGRREAFADTIFALMLTFTVSYVAFILFPVQGPRYLFPPPGGAPAEGVLYGLTHTVLESGSSRGAAFPSAHMAVAAVQTVNAARHLPRAAPPLAVLTLGIGISAVYGGFHYGVDMIVGLALGMVLAAAAPGVRRALGESATDRTGGAAGTGR